jgi:hypothetical protein
MTHETQYVPVNWNQNRVFTEKGTFEITSENKLTFTPTDQERVIIIAQGLGKEKYTEMIQLRLFWMRMG